LERKRGYVVDRDVRIVRVYDDTRREGDDDRALVDRLGPRGKSKGEVDLDEWTKDATPSTDLRRWYRHDPELRGVHPTLPGGTRVATRDGRRIETS